MKIALTYQIRSEENMIIGERDDNNQTPGN